MIVEHENGYKAITYGKRSLSIYKDGKEVLHTGSLNTPFKTEKDLYHYLGEIVPEMMKLLDENFDSIFNDEESE